MRDIERARKMLQQAALKEFPNPDRIGCPPAEALEAMARRKRPTTEADLHHITHCSPCFGAFLTIRNSVGKQRLVRTAIALASAAVLVLGIFLAAHFQTGNRPTEVIAQWNLEHASPQRGAENQRQAVVEAPRKRGTVFIQLPLGSDDGQYDVEIRKYTNAVPIRTFHGVAAIQNGHTNLPIQMDFSGLPDRRYYVAFRHADASWHFVPLVVD